MKRALAVIATLVALSAVFAVRPAVALPGNVDPNAPCFRWPAVDYDGDGVFDRVDNCPGTPKGCSVDKFGCEYDTDGDGVCDGIDRCANTPAGAIVDETGCSESQLSGGGQRTAPPVEKTVETPKPAAPAPARPVSEVERKLLETGRIRLENIYFETNSAKLLPESETTLNEVGATLEKFADLRIEIEGHTDTRGSAAYNQRLSQSRAESVREYLLAHFQLAPGNYVAKGYGESRPETRERNDEELLRNRRVELQVLNPESLPRGIQVEKN
jgi:OOP family OmpA-OmpF porin